MKRYLKPSISNGYIPIDLLLNVVYPLDMSKIMLSIPDELLKKLDAYCKDYEFERSEFVRSLIREVIYPKDMVGSSMVEQSPVKAKVEGPNPSLPALAKKPHSEVLVSPQPLSATFDLPKPEYLWDDYNLMPVYKQGEDDQFCVTWHQKGLRLRVYPIKKFRPDGSLELEGKFCRACIEGFKKQDGHLE